MLVRASEVPRVGVVAVAGRAVAVHVLLVPQAVDVVGRRAVGRRRPQRRARPPQRRIAGDAAQARVPVARCHRAEAARRQAGLGRAGRPGHRPRRVTRRDGRASAGSGADQTSPRRACAGHGRGRVARHDRTRDIGADQSAHRAGAIHRPGRPDRPDVPVVLADQRTHRAVAAHPRVRQPQREYLRVGRQAREQPGPMPRAVHEQVVDELAVAVERRVEVRRGARRRRRADGLPAHAAVVVGVVGVAGEGAARFRPGAAVAVGVEVEIVEKLVAQAVVGVGVVRGRRAGEARVVGVEHGMVERAGVVAGLVPRRRRPVAVEVPAHRVQLRQRGDVDQAVVVGVVVVVLGGRVHPAVLQHRIVVAGAEVPGVVVGVHHAVAVRVVVVPGGVDARVAGRRLQVAGGLAAALPRRLPVPSGAWGAAGLASSGQ